MSELSILFVTTLYPEFLKELYEADPALADMEYQEQKARVLDARFTSVHGTCRELSALGVRTELVLLNVDQLQEKWSRDHGLDLTGNIHDQRRQIFSAQVRDFKPDVIYVYEWSPLGDDYLSEVKREARLLVGQVASPLRPERTYGAYDLMISSWPPIVDYFRGVGISAEHQKLSFDHAILDRLGPSSPVFDVTFIGGNAPSHPNRVPWLERLLSRVDVDIFGYGWDGVSPVSPISKHVKGSAWGWRMYEVLLQSKITLNIHAINDVRGQAATNFANNLRLYEATGVGTCLLTDAKDNLGEMFVPGVEVLTFDTDEECVEKIEYYLEHEAEREAIALAGQARTLRDHTHAVRAAELTDLLGRYL